VAALRLELLLLRKMVDSNPAGLEAWMLGCLEAWRLVGFLAYSLAGLDWIGLDLSGC